MTGSVAASARPHATDPTDPTDPTRARHAQAEVA